MKTRMIKSFAIMFALVTIGYMVVSMGRVRVANAAGVLNSTVLDTSSTTYVDTSGTSLSDSVAVRAANAEDSAVADTSGSSTTPETSGSSETSGSDSDEEDDEDDDNKDSGVSSTGGCCG